MRTLTSILILFVFLVACSGNKQLSQNESGTADISAEEKAIFEEKKPDTVRIANDSVEYEIIIIDNGFYSWLNSIAQPRGYYSQNYLENRNNIYVINWNQRVMNPGRYGDLYQMRIDYDAGTDYGYEVNYQLYNYFLYFQRKYNQRLGPFIPRIN
ncbi:DUF6146 family protein [Robertkochia solimangrovi]|uniref:DUF6146 family protein n=1 Tax=Robertkochia solimangrovi TaxID=2213046 RepID=UPI00117D62AA|nr:DUF6146 family protein [Robertkochia solimangrovi]TRZ45325.1 hypothetical protein DMZ48_06145 [Robertkochia solimangrovi]